MKFLFAVTMLAFLPLAASYGCYNGDVDYKKGTESVYPMECSADTEGSCRWVEYEWGLRYGCGRCPADARFCKDCDMEMCNTPSSGATNLSKTLIIAVATSYFLVKLVY